MTYLRHLSPKSGGRYLILDTLSRGMKDLSGKVVLIDSIERTVRLPFGFFSIIGRIEGDENPASLDFSSGVRLGKAKEKKCSCLLYPFPHALSARCL